MASKQGSPVREKAEWLLRFAVMSLATPRDFRRLRLEAHRWLDTPDRGETSSDRMRSVHAVPNLAKSLIVVARRAFRPLQQARLCCKDSLHGSDLLEVSELAAEANLHASGRKPRLRRSSTTGFV